MGARGEGKTAAKCTCAHVHRRALCAHTCMGVAPAQVCEHLGARGEGSQIHIIGFLLLFACLPASPVTPTPTSLLESPCPINKTRLGPCPGPGRDASLMALPGDSPQAHRAPGWPGAQFRLLPNPLSAQRCGALSQPSLFQAGVTLTELQGLPVEVAFSRLRHRL